MNAKTLPRHIAIIMDGNGRWAKKRQLPRVAGHKVGLDVARKVVELCVKKQIEVLSLFAFSSENWRRPKDEVSYLMNLFVTMLQRDAAKLHEQNVQLRVIGDVSRFSGKLQKEIERAQQMTAQNSGLKLLIAANYGGRWDIVSAAQRLVDDIKQGRLAEDVVTEDIFHRYLSFSDLVDPDLFIRTSGETRISNFMLWQIAYTELYFTEVYWPDFNETEFEKALAFFQSRERRFGFTGEQIKETHHA